jgi:secondary thiamine-phosphate synthase enzyme
VISQFTVSTRSRTAMEDVTPQVERIVRDSQMKDGICYIYIPHTTAAVTINEGADPNVKWDILMELDKLVPLKDGYHHMEGNSDAHIKASLIGPSETLFINDGRLVLGTWQAIYLCEFDGPRRRRVMIKIIES